MTSTLALQRILEHLIIRQRELEIGPGESELRLQIGLNLVRFLQHGRLRERGERSEGM